MASSKLPTAKEQLSHAPLDAVKIMRRIVRCSMEVDADGICSCVRGLMEDQRQRDRAVAERVREAIVSDFKRREMFTSAAIVIARDLDALLEGE